VAAASTVAVDVTGILAASLLAGLGLFVLPNKRRQAKRDFHAKAEELAAAAYRSDARAIRTRVGTVDGPGTGGDFSLYAFVRSHMSISVRCGPSFRVSTTTCGASSPYRRRGPGCPPASALPPYGTSASVATARDGQAGRGETVDADLGERSRRGSETDGKLNGPDTISPPEGT
jgi:hypothetical protein